MEYSIDIQEPYKTFLLNWQKIIEWRLNKWKFKNLQIWDILQIGSWEEFIIENVSYHQSFKEMVQALWRTNIIPDAENDDEAVNVYYRFYTPDDEKKFWVVWIQVKKVSKMKRDA